MGCMQKRIPKIRAESSPSLTSKTGPSPRSCVALLLHDDQGRALLTAHGSLTAMLPALARLAADTCAAADAALSIATGAGGAATAATAMQMGLHNAATHLKAALHAAAAGLVAPDAPEAALATAHTEVAASLTQSAGWCEGTLTGLSTCVTTAGAQVGCAIHRCALRLLRHPSAECAGVHHHLHW